MLTKNALGSCVNYMWLQDEKSWLCLGSTTFIRVPTKKTTEFLEEDIKTIDATMESARTELKRRVDELRKMEGSKDLAELGFNLRPIN